MSYLDNEFFLLAVTFGVFFFSKLLQKKTGILLLNPILLTIAILIIFLKMAHISYEPYNKGGYLTETGSSSSWSTSIFTVGGHKKAIGPYPAFTTGGLHHRSSFRSGDCQTDGSTTRDNLFIGPKIRHYSHCYGSGRYIRRYSGTDGCRSGLRWIAG